MELLDLLVELSQKYKDYKESSSQYQKSLLIHDINRLYDLISEKLDYKANVAKFKRARDKNNQPTGQIKPNQQNVFYPKKDNQLSSLNPQQNLKSVQTASLYSLSDLKALLKDGAFTIHNHPMNGVISSLEQLSKQNIELSISIDEVLGDLKKTSAESLKKEISIENSKVKQALTFLEHCSDEIKIHQTQAEVISNQLKEYSQRIAKLDSIHNDLIKKFKTHLFEVKNLSSSVQILDIVEYEVWFEESKNLSKTKFKFVRDRIKVQKSINSLSLDKYEMHLVESNATKTTGTISYSEESYKSFSLKEKLDYLKNKITEIENTKIKFLNLKQAYTYLNNHLTFLKLQQSVFRQELTLLANEKKLKGYINTDIKSKFLHQYPQLKKKIYNFIKALDSYIEKNIGVSEENKKNILNVRNELAQHSSYNTNAETKRIVITPQPQQPDFYLKENKSVQTLIEQYEDLKEKNKKYYSNGTSEQQKFLKDLVKKCEFAIETLQSVLEHEKTLSTYEIKHTKNLGTISQIEKAIPKIKEVLNKISVDSNGKIKIDLTHKSSNEIKPYKKSDLSLAKSNKLQRLSNEFIKKANAIEITTDLVKNPVQHAQFLRNKLQYLQSALDGLKISQNYLMDLRIDYELSIKKNFAVFSKDLKKSKQFQAVGKETHPFEPQKRSGASAGGGSQVSGDSVNKLNSVAINDTNIKPKPGLIQNLKPNARIGGGSVASLPTNPVDALNQAVKSLADDFGYYIREQWEIEKRAATNFAKGTINGVKSLPQLSKQSFKSALKVTKQGFVLSVQGTNYALKRGVYFMPQITRVGLSKMPTAFIAAPLVFEAGHMFVIWENKGGIAALAHGGKIAAFMLCFSETLYTFGAASKNIFISTGSKSMLGALRFATPLAVGYAIYQIGNSERFLTEGLPKWAAEHPELMKAWYVPYLSEGAAWGIKTLVVKPFSYVAKPTRNKFVELGIATAQDPEYILPYDKQLELWRQSAEEYKALLAKKEQYKQRILSNFNDPKMNKVIGDLFDYMWTLILFPQFDHKQYLPYRDERGDLTSVELSANDIKTYFNTGSEIYVCPFEINLPNGRSQTYFYAVKNGAVERYDRFNNIVKRESILNETQFNHLSRLKEFKVIQVDKHTLYRIAVLNLKKPDIKTLENYLKDSLFMYFYSVGISPKILEDKNYKPSKEALERGKFQYETRLKYNRETINRYKEKTEFFENEYNHFRIYKERLGASWLKQDHFTEVRFDKSSLLPNQEGVIEAKVSLYGLYTQDKNLDNIYYLRKKRLTISIPFRKRCRDGSYETVIKEVIETTYYLYNSKGKQVTFGDIATIKAYQDNKQDIRIVRSPENGDDQLVHQYFTMINPYSGITSSKTPYKKMKSLVGDMMRLLVVNKIKGPEGKHLFLLTHYATNKALGLFKDVDSLYELFSEADIRGKYVLVKPYEANDRHDFETRVILMRSQPGEGIYTRYDATSMEASDIKGDVFRLQALENSDRYRLINPFGNNVFSKEVSLKEVDLYLSNYWTKAIVVLGTKDKSYHSKPVEQLGQDLLNAKISKIGQAVKCFHIPGRVVWRVDNDHIDNDPNVYSYYMRNFKRQEDIVTTDISQVKTFLGKRGITEQPKTDAQKQVYKQVYGRSYLENMRYHHYIPRNWVPMNKSNSVFKDKQGSFHLLEKGRSTFR